MKEKPEEVMKEISKIISESAKSSPELKDLLNRIQREGYNIFILLETSVGLKKDNTAIPLFKEKTLIKRTGNAGVHFNISLSDMEFFKKIGVDPIKKIPYREKN